MSRSPTATSCGSPHGSGALPSMGDERTAPPAIVRPERPYVPAGRGEVVDADFRVVRGQRLRDCARLLFRYRWLAGTCFGLTVGLAGLVTVVLPRAHPAPDPLPAAPHD